MPHTSFPMSDFPATRQSLLLELARRSDAAWSEFLEVYEATIYRRCRALGLQDADARDVTQEVLTAVHQRIPTWDHDASRGSFRGWLLRTARNISVDRIADRARPERAAGGDEMERRLDASVAASEAVSGEEADLFRDEFRRTTLAWALGRVREEVRDLTWRAFVGTTLEGRGAAEVAQELGVSLGSVYTAKCRVVARIQARVQELDDDA